MIIPEIFLQLREKAIEELDEAKRLDSFGYHIDVTDSWESMFNTTELLGYLSIHNTHAAKYSELSFHMLEHLDSVNNQIKLHADTLDEVGNFISTSSLTSMPNYKYDLLEMAVDWLFLSKYSINIKNVVDFGAGCGRQVVGCLQNLPNFESYIGIDASLNGYTTQNIFYSVFSLKHNLKFYDILDYQSINLPFDIKEKSTFGKSIFHFPAWMNYDLIEDKSIDLILACHVHNELSRSDFLRLMDLVETKMSNEGIFYVRSELGIWDTNNYEDKVKSHCIDPVVYLSKRNIHIVEIEYFGGFMTTIFARKDSSHFNSIRPTTKSLSLKSFEKFTKKANKVFRGKDHIITFSQIIDKLGIPAEQLPIQDKVPDIKTYKEAAFFCAAQYAFVEIARTLNRYGELQYIDEGFLIGKNIISHYSKTNTLIELLNINDLNIQKPLVINSVNYHVHEAKIPKGAYKTRLHYTYPFVIFLPELFDLSLEDLV
jgi:hypothetical protein